MRSNTDAVVMSFDDPEGLNRVVRTLLCTGVNHIIVAYGTSDGDRVAFLESIRDERLILIKEKERLGKAYSLNRALEHSNADFIIIMSSDISFDPDSLDLMERYFEDRNTGAVVPCVMPEGARGGVGSAGKLLWCLRNELLSYLDTRSGYVHGGEMLAIRRSAVDGLPAVTNDEEYLCMAIIQTGYRVRYARDIVVGNRVPGNAADYYIQRRRVIFGHRQIRTMGFRPPVLDFMLPLHPFIFLYVLFRTFTRHPRSFMHLPLLVVLESCALVMSRSYGSNSDPLKWEFAATTK